MSIAFSYSYYGGFRNSIKTDLIQMIIFLILLFILFISIFFTPWQVSSDIFDKSTDINNPAYSLIIVAILQLFSYPIHDPVMMDRGFVCSYSRTKNSFIYAFFLSIFCIFLFSLLGIIISEKELEGLSFINAIQDHFGIFISFIVFLLLIVSAISTIDSTLSSCSKLIVNDLKLLKKNIYNGRIVMLLFTLLGLLFIVFNTKDLFTAVAVSGTAATFITPVFILTILFKVRLSKISLIASFLTSFSGSIIYYLESQNINNFLSLYFDLDHKYKTLLLLNFLILAMTFFYSFIFKKK